MTPLNAQRASEQWKGVIVPLITPFSRDGSIDYKAWTDHIAFLLQSGVHGFFVNGTTGESLLLSTTERIQAAEFVIEQTAGRIPVIVQVGSLNEREMSELARAAQAAGASAQAAVAPYFFPYTERELIAYYMRLADSVGHDYPLFLYNIPANTNNKISEPVVKQVMASGANFVGLKDSSGDINQLIRYARAVSSPHRGALFAGADPLLIPALSIGANGCVSGHANAFPELVVDIFESFEAGDLVRARTISDLLDGVIAIFQNGRRLSLLKEGIRMRGLEGGTVRAPFLSVTDEERQALQRQLTALTQRNDWEWPLRVG